MPLNQYFFNFKHHVFPRHLKVLFISKLFYTLGQQMTQFVMPLFLFQLGQRLLPFSHFPLPVELSAFQQGMITIGAFYGIERLLITLWAFPASRVIARYGARTGMIVGQCLNMISVLLLSQASAHPEYIVVVMVIESIKIPLFWSSYFSLFAAFAHLKQVGRSVGTIEFLAKLMQVAAPAFAALTVVHFGFKELFFVGFSMYAISTLSLLLVKTSVKFPVPRFKQLLEWEKEPSYRRVSLSFIGKYCVDSLQFLWPLFVFLLLGSFDRVGFLYSAVFFISLVLTYFTGWYVDHRKSRTPFFVSGAVLGMLWIGRAVVATGWQVLIVETFDKLASSIFTPFYDALLIRRSKGRHALHYFTFREFIISAGAFILWSAFIIYFIFYEQWQVVVVLGAGGVLCSLFLRDKELPSKDHEQV